MGQTPKFQSPVQALLTCQPVDSDLDSGISPVHERPCGTVSDDSQAIRTFTRTEVSARRRARGERTRLDQLAPPTTIADGPDVRSRSAHVTAMAGLRPRRNQSLPVTVGTVRRAAETDLTGTSDGAAFPIARRLASGATPPPTTPMNIGPLGGHVRSRRLQDRPEPVVMFVATFPLEPARGGRRVRVSQMAAETARRSRRRGPTNGRRLTTRSLAASAIQISSSARCRDTSSTRPRLVRCAVATADPTRGDRRDGRSRLARC